MTGKQVKYIITPAGLFDEIALSMDVLKHTAQTSPDIHSIDKRDRYLFNTFSNGFCKLDNDTYDNLINNTPENTPYLDTLLQEGYVVPDAVNETNRLLVERLSYQYGKGRSMQFLIVPSLRCNLRCIYCYQRDVSENHCVITSDMIKDSIKFIETTLDLLV